MRLIILLLALFSQSAKAQDCMGESEVFFNIVAAKWAVNTGIAKDPESFDDEKWLYIWGGSGSGFEENNISDKTAKAMARLVADNNFSESPEVEVNIFEDYWYLSCKTKKWRKRQSVEEYSQRQFDRLLERGIIKRKLSKLLDALDT